MRRSGWRLAAAGAIVALAAVLLLHRLGAVDICSGNEAVEAVFLQQMVEHGELLFPLENGQQPMYKPPLFHWTATMIDRLADAHKVTAFNLRLTVALYALAGIALTIAFAWWSLGASAGLIAGLVLVGSYQFITLGRYGRVDMTLVFFETVSLLAFVFWMAPRVQRRSSEQDRSAAIAGEGVSAANARDWFLYLLGLSLGLAVLSKGPVGAFLPLAAIGVFLIAERRPDLAVGALSSPGAVLLAIAVGASWYVACLVGHREAFLHRQLGSENVGRFFGALGAMKPWYYLVPLLFNSFPLSLLAPIAMVDAMRGYSGDSRSRSRELPDSTVRLFAIFYIVSLVFFSLAAYKRRSYLLPLWPVSAVMIAWWVERISSLRWARHARLAMVTTCLILAAVNFVVIPRREARECGGDSYRPAAAEINRAVETEEPLYTYGFDEELAPLLFYLDRDAPTIRGRLGDAPPGYIIVPESVWDAQKDQAPGLEPILSSSHGNRKLILLRHGKAYAIVR